MRGKYCVYCHTNKTTGKQYVGITGRSPQKRWNYGYGYEKSPYFFNAIKKYGWDGFDHEILFDGLSKDIAERLEILLIEELQTLKPSGYNIEKGGNSIGKHSEETKRRISESHKGSKNPMYGRPISEATRAKLRLRRIWNKKHIAQYDQDGKQVGEWESASAAARAVSGDVRNISAVCRGKRRIAYGYKWSYL